MPKIWHKTPPLPLDSSRWAKQNDNRKEVSLKNFKTFPSLIRSHKVVGGVMCHTSRRVIEMTRCFLYCSPLSGSNIKDGACRSVQKWTLLIPAPAGRDPSRHHRQTPLIKPVGSVHSLNMHISRRLICPEPNQVYIPVNFFNIASFYYL